ncbi:hypothetical protein CR513_31720, partial [Mucuna pruriens]
MEIDLEHNDSMVVTIEVANFAVKKVLVDQGSSTDILYLSTFKHLQIPLTEIRLHHEQLVGFSSEQCYINSLKVGTSDQPRKRTDNIAIIVELDLRPLVE